LTRSSLAYTGSTGRKELTGVAEFTTVVDCEGAKNESEAIGDEDEWEDSPSLERSTEVQAPF
jgi:hypothetical protein